MMANTLAWRRLYRDCRHLRLGLCLGLAVAFLPMMASAQPCHQNYVVENRTTIAIKEFFYEQNGQWSPHPLEHYITTRYQFILVGEGRSEFAALLSGGTPVYGWIPDICHGRLIIICRGDRSIRECRNDGSGYIMVAG